MTTRAVRGLVVVAVVSLAGCGDDANDHAYLNQRAVDLAERFRAGETTVVTPGAEPGTTEPSAIPVKPTGVVVPVIALDNTFRPERLEIVVGDEVLWENRGQNEHDILSIEGTLADGTAWGVDVAGFQPRAIYSHVFTEAGEYRYYCTIHGNAEVGMVGTIVVVDPDT